MGTSPHSLGPTGREGKGMATLARLNDVFIQLTLIR